MKTGDNHEDTIVFEKLQQYLRDNNKKNGYCTDYNLHCVAKLVFKRKSNFFNNTVSYLTYCLCLSKRVNMYLVSHLTFPCLST